MEAGQIFDKKYRLVRKLSTSAMGSVWEATELRDERRVAIKALNEHLVADGALISRLLKEARAALKAKPSDHVIDVLDVVSGRGRPFYVVMEYLEGTDLRRLLEEEKRLAPKRAVEFAVQACSALDEIHGRGIVHGRLRPESFFISKPEKGDEQLKLIDVGVPTFKPVLPRHGMTTTGVTRIESPEYLAPEQLRDTEELDPRVDIYALSVLLYNMLTGKLPFDTEDTRELMHLITKGSPLPLRHHRSALGLGLEQVVMKAMSLKLSQRHRTMGELAIALMQNQEAREKIDIPPPPAPDLIGIGPPASMRNVTEDLKIEDLEFIVGEPGPRDVTSDLDVEDLEFIDANAVEELEAEEAPLSALPSDEEEPPPISEQLVSPLDSGQHLDFTFAGRRRIAIWVVSALGGISVIALLSVLICSSEAPERRPVGSGGSPDIAALAKAKQDAAPTPVPDVDVHQGVPTNNDDAAPEAAAEEDSSVADARSSTDAFDPLVAETASSEPEGETEVATSEPVVATQPVKRPAVPQRPIRRGGTPAQSKTPADATPQGKSPAPPQKGRQKAPPEVTTTLRALAPAVKRCYRFRSDASVLVRYRVTSSGSVAFQAASPRPSRMVERCLSRTAQGAKAPPLPDGAVTVNVRYRLQ